MTLRLSTDQLRHVQRVIHLLVSPLSHSSIDCWRSQVNRELKALFQADSAGFLLPGTGGALLFSEEHDPAQIAKYPDMEPPPVAHGVSLWERALELRVSTVPSAYGSEARRYWDSAYYNEYARPNGAAQTLAASVALGGADPRSMATVHLWRDSANPRTFDDDDMALLSLLYPALTSGVESYVRFGADAADFLRACDSLGNALMICDTGGRPAHTTPALERLLASEPESGRLRIEMEAVARNLAAVLAVPAPAGAAPAAISASDAHRVRLETHTRSARYLVRGSTLRSTWMAGPWVLIALERTTQAQRSAADLQAQFGLTPTEARVAVLLRRGQTSAHIAAELGLSPATVRRHTERIFLKLNVRTRAAAAALL